eukprot:COSAG01_NODE_5007_length_4548_cov_5.216903_5_plen_72_part_00
MIACLPHGRRVMCITLPGDGLPPFLTSSSISATIAPIVGIELDVFDQYRTELHDPYGASAALAFLIVTEGI